MFLEMEKIVHLHSKPLQGCSARQNKSKKTMKWYRRVERKLMEISLYNSYVIEGEVVDHSKRDFLSYKLDLIHQLIGDNRHQL